MVKNGARLHSKESATFHTAVPLYTIRRLPNDILNVK